MVQWCAVQQTGKMAAALGARTRRASPRRLSPAGKPILPDRGIAMTDPTRQVSRSTELSAKVAQMMQKRLTVAQEHFTERARKAYETYGKPAAAQPKSPMEMWTDAADYAVDFAQRSVLFWDTMRQRGNVSVEHARAGLPPVLHFQYEMVMDGRTLAQAGQLRPGAHRPAGGRQGGRPQAPLRDHRPPRGPRPRHRRHQGGLGGRRGAARGPPGVLRHLLSRAGAGADLAGRLQRGEAVRAARARAPSRRPTSRRSSATARAAGPR